MFEEGEEFNFDDGEEFNFDDEVSNSFRTPQNHIVNKRPLQRRANDEEHKKKKVDSSTSLNFNNQVASFSSPNDSWCDIKKNTRSSKNVVKRKFPGPAGLLPDHIADSSFYTNDKTVIEQKNNSFADDEGFICSQRSVSVFEDSPWMEMFKEFKHILPNNSSPVDKYNIKWIKTQANQQKLINQKVPFLAALINNIETEAKATSIRLLLKDTTGEIDAVILNTLYESYSEEISIGSVIVLKQFGVLSTGSKLCLTITPKNLITIYSAVKNSIEQLSQNLSDSCQSNQIFGSIPGPSREYSIKKTVIQDVSSKDLISYIDNYEIRANSHADITGLNEIIERGYQMQNSRELQSVKHTLPVSSRNKNCINPSGLNDTFKSPVPFQNKSGLNDTFKLPVPFQNKPNFQTAPVPPDTFSMTNNMIKRQTLAHQVNIENKVEKKFIKKFNFASKKVTNIFSDMNDIDFLLDDDLMPNQQSGQDKKDHFSNNVNANDKNIAERQNSVKLIEKSDKESFKQVSKEISNKNKAHIDSIVKDKYSTVEHQHEAEPRVNKSYLKNKFAAFQFKPRDCDEPLEIVNAGVNKEVSKNELSSANVILTNSQLSVTFSNPEHHEIVKNIFDDIDANSLFEDF